MDINLLKSYIDKCENVIQNGDRFKAKNLFLEIQVEKKQKKNFKNKYYVPFTDELFEIVPLTDNKIFNLSYEGAKTYFSRLFKKLNIENASIHSFRHTFISTCYFAGFDLKFIQKIAGHNNFNMTTDIYTHLLKNGNSVILEYIKKLKNPCNFLP